MNLFKWAVAKLNASVFGSPDDWLENQFASAPSPKGLMVSPKTYDPDEITRSFNEPVKSPVLQMIEDLKAGKAEITEAHLLKARFNEDGKILKEGRKTYRVAKVKDSPGFLACLAEAERAWQELPAKAQKVREIKEKMLEALKDAKLREDFVDSNSTVDAITTTADQSQFTEYTPIMGGPFYRQLYMFDHLRSIALAFEAYHHNPIAKRIPEILTDYTVGRGFKLVCKDQDYLAQVEDVVNDIGLHWKIPVWSDEEAIYGELAIDTIKWQSIDPSTIWQIVHEPDDVNKEIYYFQSYPTDYMMFTGYKVPGAPGAEKTPSMCYIIRQIPAEQVIHIKSNVVSNEVRGRSVYFPIHGWLKMAKDLLEAEVVRAKLQASFVFDDTVKGSDADVVAHANAYTGMPVAGSVFAHNEAVERKPIQVMTGSAMGYNSGTFAAILSVIATNTGIPAEFLNVESRGSNRATALVSSDPFAKVIARRQIKFESLIKKILAIELPRRGLKYDADNLEVVFPSVSKDTTSETIKNLTICEGQGYISKRRAGNMAAAELDITEYDYEEEQEQMKKDLAAGLDQVGDLPPPGGRSGGEPGFDSPMSGQSGGGSDIVGQGKSDVQDEMNTI